MSSPGFQFAGVATRWRAESWSASTTRRISSKLRPTCAGIGEHQLDPFRRRDDEHAAHGHGLAESGAMPEVRRVEHSEEHRHPPILVGDDRKIHPRRLGLVDVGDPALVILAAVDAQADDLHATPRPFVAEPGGDAELGGADRGEVGRMREEHAPVLADELVKADAPQARPRREVRDAVADADVALPPELLLRPGEGRVGAGVLELEGPAPPRPTPGAASGTRGRGASPCASSPSRQRRGCRPADVPAAGRSGRHRSRGTAPRPACSSGAGSRCGAGTGRSA